MTNVIKLPKMNVEVDEQKFLLEAGDHTMTVKEVRQTTVKSGINAGKLALNVGLANEENVWVWKQLPMWTLAKTAPKNEKDWFRMSTIAFLKAVNTQVPIERELNLDDLVGLTVVTRVGIQNNGGEYGDQNFVVTFVS